MTDLRKPISILFVCTGNICRSPTAEAVFRRKILEIYPDYQGLIDSAGLQGYHIGDPPDHRTVRIAQENGTPMAGLFARKFVQADFEKFDCIIAMDRGHYEALKNRALAAYLGQIHLFLDCHPDYKGQDVPDPYYGGISDFRNVYGLIDQGVDALIEALIKE